jgi:hypothetical protein
MQMTDKTVPALFTGFSEIVFHEARAELEQILNAGARALKPAGIALMPIKREMLGLSDIQADLILDALNLLFAAVLAYEGAQWSIETATDAIDLVSARIEAGRALGVVESLFYGPTRLLFATAMDRAPIAYFALSEASPTLKIVDRTRATLSAF